MLKNRCLKSRTQGARGVKFALIALKSERGCHVSSTPGQLPRCGYGIDSGITYLPILKSSLRVQNFSLEASSNFGNYRSIWNFAFPTRKMISTDGNRKKKNMTMRYRHSFDCKLSILFKKINGGGGIKIHKPLKPPHLLIYTPRMLDV
uniref:Uncharacterized protein n=1 Tax=Arsenophonus endosymbiont of Trialeurodes vaporariorum TaxID=235567 RepID=A0A3B0M214_9GAMM